MIKDDTIKTYVITQNEFNAILGVLDYLDNTLFYGDEPNIEYIQGLNDLVYRLERSKN